MKKLLVTAIGAAVAFGAFADSMRFESAEDGVKTISTLPGGDSYWSELAGSTNTYTVGAAGAIAPAPLPIASEGSQPNKALEIKTTFGKPLSFNAVSGGAATNINDGLYFDSLVKFTVCEDAPADTYSGAKIIMWLQEKQDASGNATGTNLIVRAGYLSGGDTVAATPTNYVCALPNGFNADAWHRVTIKAIADITKTNRGVPGFAIYLDRSENTDNTAMSDINAGTADMWDDSFPASELTEAASSLNDSCALFPSLDVTSGNKATLTSASFDGTGSITDLIFTDNGPAFAKDMAAPKASVTIGNTTTSYSTLAEAVAAVNGVTSGDVTFQLSKGMTIGETLAFASTANVVLDFAGYVLTNTLGTAAITNNCNLTITNSTDAVGGIVGVGEGSAAIYQGEGFLNIFGGIFRADIEGFAAGNLELAGGSFQQPKDAFAIEVEDEIIYLIAQGKTFSAQSATYDGLYDVVDAPTGVAQIGTNYYETFAAALAAAVDGDTITLLDNVAEAKFTITADTFTTQGLTIDLGGYTYTFNTTSASEDAIYLLKGNKLTIANGTIAAGANSTYRDVIRDYDSDLTLTNVTFNGANFPAADGEKLACLLCVEGGDVDIVGSTSFINVNAAYAIKLGNHAQSYYIMGTTTVNTTGNIEGNVLIAGGVYNEVAVGSGSTINYYYGKNVHSSWEDGVSSANFAARLGTLPTAAGTQDNVSGQLFKTLKEAVDAAQADDTVTVLADCTVADPIVFSAGITVSNDYTVTLNASYALRFANGNTPVTICGSGSFVGNGTGSPLLVGSNEVKSSYGIQSTYSASLVLEGCTFSAKSGQGNIIKVENGTLTVNDATITTDATNVRGVKADGDVGSYTATVIINGGTINAAKASVASSASADSGKTTSGTANVTINGGSITGQLSCGQNTSGTATITIPGTSEAKFSVQPAAAYVASGYETVLSDGWYVVTAVKPSGIDPASDTPSAVVTAASADAAIEAVAVVAPTGVDAAAYKANFDFTATPNGDGTFTVTLTGIKEDVQEAVSKDAVDVLTSDKATTVDVPAGLCYKVTTYTALGGAAVETKSGTSDGTGVSVSKPGTTQGFIKVEMATKPFN